MTAKHSDSVVKFFVSVIGLILIFAVLKELAFILIPLVVAYFLFFLFEPLNDFLEKWRIPSGIVLILDLVIFMGTIGLISSVIIDSFTRLGTQLPEYTRRLNFIVSSQASAWGIKDKFFLHFDLGKLLSGLDYSDIAGSFFSSTVSIFTSLFLVMFFFIFVSSGNKRILAAIKERYAQKDITTDDTKEIASIKHMREHRVEKTVRDIKGQVQRYLATKFFLNLIVSLLVSLVLWLFNVDFLMVWAVFTFLFNFIPSVGSIAAVLLPMTMALVQYGSLPYALLIALILAVVENVMGSIVEPKVVGNRLGLNPLVILLSLLLWGYIWGLAGMFLSVPVTAVVKIIISNSGSKNMQLFNDLMSN